MSASVPSWAVPGAKVVAVGRKGAGEEPLHLPPSWVVTPEIGKIYTIRYVERWGRKVGIYLVEIVNGLMSNGEEPGWAIEAFRPLVTRSQEQDVAQFRKLLIGAPKGVDA